MADTSSSLTSHKSSLWRGSGFGIGVWLALWGKLGWFHAFIIGLCWPLFFGYYITKWAWLIGFFTR